MGRSKFSGNQLSCKLLTVLLGDNQASSLKDLEHTLALNLPLIIMEGSDLAKEIFAVTDGTAQPTGSSARREIISKVAKRHYVRCKESSEDLASIVHLMLAVTLF